MRDNYSSKIPRSLIPYTLPSNWTWFFWSDIMKSYQQGMIRSNRELGEGNVYYLKMGDLNDNGVVNLTDLSITNATEKEIKEFQLTEGDFLINVRNSRELVGKTCVIRKIDKTILYNHMLVRINNGSPEMNYFINAFLNIPSSKKLLDRIKQGTTTVIALYQRELNQLPIPLPDTSTFNTIISLYKSIDAKIELNNRINRELEAMAKTLYDYWFVQFDFPVDNNFSPSGEMSVGQRGYKSSGGKMVYNQELKREIPEGWAVKKLSQIAKTGSGGTPLSTKREYYENGEIPWINSGEVNEPFIVSTNNFITQAGLNNSSAKLFKKGTILMAMYGATAGKVSLIDLEACTNQAICGINPNKEFYKYYIKFGLEDLYKYLINLSSGSARDNLSQDKIKELRFIIPNDSLLMQFDKLVQPTMNKILTNLKQNQHLAALRDWLLPMLMNGQVTVRQAHGNAVQEAEERLSMAAEPSVEYKKG